MSTIDLTEEILTTKKAAEVLGIDYTTFINKRCIGDLDNLPAYKIPNLRGYRYLKSEIITWMKGFQEKPRRGRKRKAQ